MTLRDISPWKWGGLRRWRHDGEPLTDFHHEMETLRKEMDRLFDDMSNMAFLKSPFPRSSGGDLLMPKIDEIEDDKAFHVSIELPGMDEKDVDITLSDRWLTIRGEKKQEMEDKDSYRSERSYGAFRRMIELPGDVDESKIEASFKKGVLSVELPKTKEAQEKIKHIAVKVA